MVIKLYQQREGTKGSKNGVERLALGRFLVGIAMEKEAERRGG
jgi:hypothetical protein